MNWREFERIARKRMSQHFGVQLGKGTVPGVPKEFDLVSDDRTIVGDAKYLSLVQGVRLPPAKFMEIAAHVWLLEKTKAPVQFLVFGNQREVPEWWLSKYGDLIGDVQFLFLSDEGEISTVSPGRPSSPAPQQPLSIPAGEPSGGGEWFIYENWQAGPHKAVLHHGACGYCNWGKGRAGGYDRSNAQWHGPFYSIEKARMRWRGMDVVEHRECRCVGRFCGGE